MINYMQAKKILETLKVVDKNILIKMEISDAIVNVQSITPEELSEESFEKACSIISEHYIEYVENGGKASVHDFCYALNLHIRDNGGIGETALNDVYWKGVFATTDAM